MIGFLHRHQHCGWRVPCTQEPERYSLLFIIVLKGTAVAKAPLTCHRRPREFTKKAIEDAANSRPKRIHITLSLSHTHTHTHTNTRTPFLSLTHTHTHAKNTTLSLSLSLSHTHTHTHTKSHHTSDLISINLSNDPLIEYITGRKMFIVARAIANFLHKIFPEAE